MPQCDCGAFKETVLTLDGGGIRGYSSLLILDDLMNRCGQHERELDRRMLEQLGVPPNEIREAEDRDPPLPCHYFDYIFGTSTGGLIAIMLGRLRMTVKGAREAYASLAKDVFGSRRRLKFYQFSHRKLQRVIQGVIQRHCPDPDTKGDGLDRFLDPERKKRRICRCGVIAVRRDDSAGDQLHLFRSYFHAQSDDDSRRAVDRARIRNPGADDRTCIWEAARATSATPHYFKQIVIHPNSFMDGGIAENNSSSEAWAEVEDMHKENCQSRNGAQGQARRDDVPLGSGIGTLVSVGTGIHAPLSTFSDSNVFHKVWKIWEKAKEALTDPEKTHDAMERTARADGVPYYRLNVDSGLEHVKMDECKLLKAKRREPDNITISRIREATSSWLNRSDVKEILDECASKLVQIRRGRTAGNHGSRFRGLTTRGHLDMYHVQQQRSWDDMRGTTLSHRGVEMGRSFRNGPFHDDAAQHRLPRIIPLDNIARGDPNSRHTSPRGPPGYGQQIFSPTSQSPQYHRYGGGWYPQELSNGPNTAALHSPNDIDQVPEQQFTNQVPQSDAMSPRPGGPSSGAYEMSSAAPASELGAERDPQEVADAERWYETS